MRVRIIYATYTGTTQAVSQVIEGYFSRCGFDTTLESVEHVEVTNFRSDNLVLFGTPSWKVHNLEGQPHSAYNTMFARFPASDFADTSCAVFGCGNSAFNHFCGGVDILSRWLMTRRSRILFHPLKLDRYRSGTSTPAQIESWCAVLQETVHRLSSQPAPDRVILTK